LRRFLAAAGGFVDQTSNYSFGTALTFLPHILGSAQAVTGPLTSWQSIARHTRLFVLFGGANPKNTQVAKGGCAWHGTSGAFTALAQAGVRVVNISPIREDGPQAVSPEWIPIRPNTDTAMMLALAHTLVSERCHDEAFLGRYCSGFDRVLPYLTGAKDGVPKDAAWAAAITGVAAGMIRALARQMAATRTMLTASWSLQRRPWRTALLGISTAGSVSRPDWVTGRRVRLRLRLWGCTCRAAAVVSRAGNAGADQSSAAGDTCRPHHRLSAAPGRALRL
jgi:biotin/methionine sulfoxide reductase